MSRRNRRGGAGRPRENAEVFAALGNATRLALVAKLCGGAARSIAELTEDSQMTRQAITKHLRVLQGAGIVYSAREGRESRYALDREPIVEAREYLEVVSAEWDRALGRLKALVEK
jgi:DNA-binding transcriptional ArsR family regulator